MKKIFYSLLVFSSIVYSQTTKEVGEFTKITSFDQIDVFLIKSDENKILIDGKEADEVELVNKNGELKIRMPLEKLLQGDNISVTVYFKKLTSVEANEGSRIACGDTIKTVVFDVNAKEGSEVKLILDLDELNVKVKNGSNIELQGNSITQEVVVNSGGRYLAPGLKTNQTSVTVTAGGEALVFATNIVNAKVRAGGNVTISGEPKQINKDIVAGGTICEVKKK